MTTQHSDIIAYQGNDYFLDQEPLSALGTLPAFVALTSANYRGYIATWGVTDEKLFLIEMSGFVDGNEKAAIELVFPRAKPPVFAHWYSGTLKLNRGRLLASALHDGWYEHELELTVLQGDVVSKRTISKEEAARRVLDPVLFSSVSLLVEVPQSLIQQLRTCSIHRIGDLVQLSADDLQAKTGMEKNAIRNISGALAQLGLLLGNQMPGWPPELLT